MIYVFDTDLFTLAELPDSPQFSRLRARIAQLPPEDTIVTTIVNYEEQTRGWLAYAARSRQIEHQIKAYARLKRHLANYMKWEILEFDARAALRYQTLLAAKLRIGASDQKIAAIVLSVGGTLLSRNRADFEKVPSLAVEDWTTD